VFYDVFIYLLSSDHLNLQKAEYDQIGGEAIRDTSMWTLQRRKCDDFIMDSDSDTENKPSVSKRANKKLHRSVLKTSSDDMKELKDMLASAEKSCQESSQEMVETLNKSPYSFQGCTCSMDGLSIFLEVHR
jgi:hypothetical protein